VRCGDRAAKIATRDNRVCRDQKEPERIAEIPAHNDLNPIGNCPVRKDWVVEIVPRHSHPRKLEHHRNAKMARLRARPRRERDFCGRRPAGRNRPGDRIDFTEPEKWLDEIARNGRKGGFLLAA